MNYIYLCMFQKLKHLLTLHLFYYPFHKIHHKIELKTMFLKTSSMEQFLKYLSWMKNEHL